MVFQWSSVIIAVVFCLVALYLRKLLRRPSKLPPGPPQIPILGNIHQMGTEPHKTFMNLANTYGDIFSFQFGSYSGVILNGHKTIKEALSLPAFNGRHQETASLPREGGIVLSEEKDWAEQRRFALKTLRDFGFGKKNAESLIIDEVQELVDRFRKSAGTPQDFSFAFNAVVLNSLWAMLTGGHFAHDDPRLRDLITTLNASLQAEGLPTFVKLALFIPWMRPFKIFIPMARAMMVFVAKTLAMMKGIVEEHKGSLMPDHVGNYVDAYLKEIENTKDPNSSFWRGKGEQNLRVSLFDLFLGGTETTASTLTYALQYLAIHADVQDKLYQSIENVIGNSRLPTLADRPNLPYAEATIMEILRFSSLLPRALPHGTTETVEFKGFVIPKGTLVIPNLYSAHFDPNVWGDPENFRPERFLNPDGQLSRHQEAFMPFSTGKRICPGESLARDQLFLILCSLVQRFNFKPDPKSPRPLKVDYSVTPLILAPVPKLLLMEERV